MQRKTLLRLLLLACLLAVLPALAGEPAVYAITCNQSCWNDFKACKATCNGYQPCIDACRANQQDCLCFRCGLC